MFADFLIKAVLAGFILALISGPLGCFIVWRRMAYFGDTLAHSALLGIALGLLADINPQFSVIFSCVAVALVLTLMERRRTLGTDTILGILAHSSLAAGLVLLSFTDTRIDLMAYLFGDLLAVSNTELLWLFAGGLFTALMLAWHWNQLLAITLHEELAQVEGINVEKLRLILLILLAVIVAVSMKIVGVLLITSLLIIPPAVARNFAKSPEQMALGASLTGCIAVAGGITTSWLWDTPTGPSIVVIAALLFCAGSVFKR